MELHEAISVAIEYELRVFDHYDQCAGATGDPRGQRVFATLAREEQGHVEFLRDRLAEWRTTGILDEGALPPVEPSMVWLQEQAADPAGAARSGQPAEPPELEFLRQALVLEHKTSTFYREMVNLLEPGHRGLFERFLAIERGHVALVQAAIDALAGQGRWLETGPGAR